MLDKQLGVLHPHAYFYQLGCCPPAVHVHAKGRRPRWRAGVHGGYQWCWIGHAPSELGLTACRGNVLCAHLWCWEHCRELTHAASSAPRCRPWHGDEYCCTVPRSAHLLECASGLRAFLTTKSVWASARYLVWYLLCEIKMKECFFSWNLLVYLHRSANLGKSAGSRMNGAGKGLGIRWYPFPRRAVAKSRATIAPHSHVQQNPIFSGASGCAHDYHGPLHGRMSVRDRTFAMPAEYEPHWLSVDNRKIDQ